MTPIKTISHIHYTLCNICGVPKRRYVYAKIYTQDPEETVEKKKILVERGKRPFTCEICLLIKDAPC